MIQSIRSTSWTGYMLMKVLGLREPNTFGNIVYVCIYIYIYIYIYITIKPKIFQTPDRIFIK